MIFVVYNYNNNRSSVNNHLHSGGTIMHRRQLHSHIYLVLLT